MCVCVPEGECVCGMCVSVCMCVCIDGWVGGRESDALNEQAVFIVQGAAHHWRSKSLLLQGRAYADHHWNRPGLHSASADVCLCAHGGRRVLPHREHSEY